MERPEELLAVAHLLRPWGNRGLVSAVALAPPVLDPVDLIVGRRLYLRDPQGNAVPVTAVELKEHKGRWMIGLEGAATISDAEALRGHDLCLPRAELPELPEGWYWEADLQQCRVIDARLGEIGTVKALDVDQFQPQLIVNKAAGGEVRIPWVKAFFEAVDVEAGEIRSQLPVGLPGLEDDHTEEAR